MDTQIYRFKWRGIEIKARYTPPLKWGAIAYLEIEAIKPEREIFPTTETGYRSHFNQPGTIESLGGDAATQVTAWLDEEARRPEWVRVDKTRNQLSLF